MFSLEALVEFLGYLVDIEGSASTAGHIYYRDRLFLVNAYRNLLESLNQRLP